jgi:hypothetical protein
MPIIKLKKSIIPSCDVDNLNKLRKSFYVNYKKSNPNLLLDDELTQFQNRVK